MGFFLDSILQISNDQSLKTTYVTLRSAQRYRSSKSERDPCVSTIINSRAAFQILKNEFNRDAEEFWGLFLNNHLEIIEFKLIHRGTMDHCTVHPRDLFREALRLNSCAVIIAHNHPSKILDPSTSDIMLTKKFKKIGQLIQIPIIDHVIFSDSQYFSFKENSMI